MDAMLLRMVITILLGSVLSMGGVAQTTIDVIHLKDGRVIKGVIIEQVEGRYLRVQLTDGQLVVLAAADVSQISREQVSVSGAPRKWRGKDPSAYLRKGFVNHTAAGAGIGIGSVAVETAWSTGNNYSGNYRNDEKYVRLETVNGWWVGRGLMTLGVGLGLEYYRYIQGWLQMPVHADIRLFPLSGAITPVIVLQGGWSVGLTEVPAYGERRNGPQAAGGLGLHWARSKGRAMNISVLYDWHAHRDEGTYVPEITFKETSSSGYLRLTGGVSF